MIDSIIAGTGNSRYLRSSIPAGTTWDDALAMLQAGTFPIDLAGVNAAGFTTLGTPLNSANLLKSAVITALGLSSDATPSDAWEAILALIADKVDEEEAADAAPVQSVAGKTGDVTLDAGDVEYDPDDTYSNGTVGQNLHDANVKIINAYPSDTASGAVASFPDGAALPVKSLVVSIEPLQPGSGDPSPDNVRPIYGWTGANVFRTGRNMFDKSTATLGKCINNSGGITNRSGTDAFYSDFIPIYAKVGDKYKYTAIGRDGDGVVVRIVLYDRNKNWIKTENSPGSGNNRNKVGITVTQEYVDAGLAFLRISAYNAGCYENAMLTVGDEYPTEYAPYTGTAVSVSWQTEAGTVYGGSLDVLTGVLTVTMANIASYAGESINEPRLSSMDKYVSGATPITGAQVVYTLAAPETYQLTAQEAASMLGANSIWVDTGDVTVAYRADPTLYIRKLTGSAEDDMIADANIANGKYFMVGNRLFLSTAAITAGDAIVPGTNCTETNLVAALNALNT